MHDGRNRVVIEGVKPEVDAGTVPVKRVIGDSFTVEADLFTDGHDAISGCLLWRKEGAFDWQETRLEALTNDRWRGSFSLTELGRYEYTVHGWVDHFKSWQRDMRKRIAAGQDTAVDYRIGAELVEEAAGRATGSDAVFLRAASKRLEPATVPSASQRDTALDDALTVSMSRFPDRQFATRYSRELVVAVDPPKARFSSWYEFFPRSTAREADRHGSFADAEAELVRVADMGFDVVYFPPIHPIGTQFRKGRNNAVAAQEGDVGSPWAIGAAEGGHKETHGELGTVEDFKRLVRKAGELGIDIALDIAFQVSPDHPYVQNHPEWFRRRPDGTIQYAENPPKKYQDIYPFDFESTDYAAMWAELKSIFEFWVSCGVHIFRVDNPHTKAFPFWQWCIAELKSSHPQLIFLSEAFTRPKVMYRLAKLGFTQSYTYFPWRHTKQEIEEYFTEITQTEVREFFRPNHWPNTPDILTEFLQTSGRPGFMCRLLLAATLGANYGIYGPAFELMDHEPREPGSEEYLDSEKYQLRHWDRNRPGSLAELISSVNRIRKDNPALQNDWSLRFHRVDNEDLICYSKASVDGANLVVVVVNLDVRYRHSGHVELPLEALLIDPGHPYQLHELLTDARYIWHGPRNYVEIDPHSVPAQMFRVRRKLRTEREFEYFG